MWRHYNYITSISIIIKIHHSIPSQQAYPVGWSWAGKCASFDFISQSYSQTKGVTYLTAILSISGYSEQLYLAIHCRRYQGYKIKKTQSLVHLVWQMFEKTWQRFNFLNIPSRCSAACCIYPVTKPPCSPEDMGKNVHRSHRFWNYEQVINNRFSK